MNPLLILKLAGGVAILAIALGLWNKIQAVAQLEAVVETQKSSIWDLQTANNTTNESLVTCQSANSDYAENAQATLRRAMRAEVRLAAFEAAVNKDIEDIFDDESELRKASLSDETCYTLVDRLPDGLFD